MASSTLELDREVTQRQEQEGTVLDLRDFSMGAESPVSKDKKSTGPHGPIDLTVTPFTDEQIEEILAAGVEQEKGPCAGCSNPGDCSKCAIKQIGAAQSVEAAQAEIARIQKEAEEQGRPEFKVAAGELQITGVPLVDLTAAPAPVPMDLTAAPVVQNFVPEPPREQEKVTAGVEQEKGPCAGCSNPGDCSKCAIKQIGAAQSVEAAQAEIARIQKEAEEQGRPEFKVAAGELKITGTPVVDLTAAPAPVPMDLTAAPVVQNFVPEPPREQEKVTAGVEQEKGPCAGCSNPGDCSKCAIKQIGAAQSVEAAQAEIARIQKEAEEQGRPEFKVAAGELQITGVPLVDLTAAPAPVPMDLTAAPVVQNFVPEPPREQEKVTAGVEQEKGPCAGCSNPGDCSKCAIKQISAAQSVEAAQAEIARIQKEAEEQGRPEFKVAAGELQITGVPLVDLTAAPIPMDLTAAPDAQMDAHSKAIIAAAEDIKEATERELQEVTTRLHTADVQNLTEVDPTEAIDTKTTNSISHQAEDSLILEAEKIKDNPDIILNAGIKETEELALTAKLDTSKQIFENSEIAKELNPEAVTETDKDPELVATSDQERAVVVEAQLAKEINPESQVAEDLATDVKLQQDVNPINSLDLSPEEKLAAEELLATAEVIKEQTEKEISEEVEMTAALAQTQDPTLAIDSEKAPVVDPNLEQHAELPVDQEQVNDLSAEAEEQINPALLAEQAAELEPEVAVELMMDAELAKDVIIEQDLPIVPETEVVTDLVVDPNQEVQIEVAAEEVVEATTEAEITIEPEQEAKLEVIAEQEKEITSGAEVVTEATDEVLETEEQLETQLAVQSEPIAEVEKEIAVAAELHEQIEPVVEQEVELAIAPTEEPIAAELSEVIAPTVAEEIILAADIAPDAIEDLKLAKELEATVTLSEQIEVEALESAETSIVEDMELDLAELDTDAVLSEEMENLIELLIESEDLDTELTIPTSLKKLLDVSTEENQILLVNLIDVIKSSEIKEHQLNQLLKMLNRGEDLDVLDIIPNLNLKLNDLLSAKLGKMSPAEFKKVLKKKLPNLDAEELLQLMLLMQMMKKSRSKFEDLTLEEQYMLEEFLAKDGELTLNELTDQDIEELMAQIKEQLMETIIKSATTKNGLEEDTAQI